MSNIHRSLGNRRTCVSFAASSFTNVMPKRRLVNVRIAQFNHFSFPDLPAVNLFLFPAVKTTLIQIIFYNVKHLKFIATVHCTLQNIKHGVCLNSGSHRILNHVTVRTECHASVTNRGILLFTHKQQISIIVCVWVCVSNYVSFLCVCCVHFQLCMPKYVCLIVRDYLCFSNCVSNLCLILSKWGIIFMCYFYVSNCVCLIVFLCVCV